MFNPKHFPQSGPGVGAFPGQHVKNLEVDIHEIGFNGRNCFLRAAAGGKIETRLSFIRFAFEMTK